MPVNCVHFRYTPEIGTIYRSWSDSGSYTNRANAYDGSYGDTSTYASGATTGATGKSATYSNTTSLTGMSNVSLKIRNYYTLGSGADQQGNLTITYTWDNTNWYDIANLIYGTDSNKTNTDEETFTLGYFDGSTNLNTLKIQFVITSGYDYDSFLDSYVYHNTTNRIYDIGISIT